jgi:hypothetical protein
MVLQKVVPGICIERRPFPASPNPADHVISMKAEEDSDTEVSEKPLPISFPGIKAEHMVSSMHVCALLGSFHKYPE